MSFCGTPTLFQIISDQIALMRSQNDLIAKYFAETEAHKPSIEAAAAGPSPVEVPEHGPVETVDNHDERELPPAPTDQASDAPAEAPVRRRGRPPRKAAEAAVATTPAVSAQVSVADPAPEVVAIIADPPLSEDASGLLDEEPGEDAFSAPDGLMDAADTVDITPGVVEVVEATADANDALAASTPEPEASNVVQGDFGKKPAVTYPTVDEIRASLKQLGGVIGNTRLLVYLDELRAKYAFINLADLEDGAVRQTIFDEVTLERSVA